MLRFGKYLVAWGLERSGRAADNHCWANCSRRFRITVVLFPDTLIGSGCNRLIGTSVDDPEQHCKQYCDTLAARRVLCAARRDLAHWPDLAIAGGARVASDNRVAIVACAASPPNGRSMGAQPKAAGQCRANGVTNFRCVIAQLAAWLAGASHKRRTL